MDDDPPISLFRGDCESIPGRHSDPGKTSVGRFAPIGATIPSVAGFWPRVKLNPEKDATLREAAANVVDGIFRPCQAKYFVVFQSSAAFAVLILWRPIFNRPFLGRLQIGRHVFSFGHDSTPIQSE